MRRWGVIFLPLSSLSLSPARNWIAEASAAAASVAAASVAAASVAAAAAAAAAAVAAASAAHADWGCGRCGAVRERGGRCYDDSCWCAPEWWWWRWALTGRRSG